MNAPAQRRRHPLVKLLVVLLLCAVAALIALLVFARRTKPIKTTNVLGEAELCTSCHPLAKHPAIKGHPLSAAGASKGKATKYTLAAIGCVPCHGGDGGKLKKELAHAPKLGEGRDPFLPKAHYEVGCARCHVIGQIAGLTKLKRGLVAYRQGTCVGCHGPGHQPPEIGPSLRAVPQKPEAYLRRWLLDSRAVLPTASMWSIRDATYRGSFGASAEGKQNLSALITYVLMVADEPQRRTYREHGQRPKLRIDAPCQSCHALGPGAKVSGAKHRCTMLKDDAALLDCKRCHGKAATTPPKDAKRMCPQVAAAAHLCETCHLREDDGLKQLLQNARRLRTR
jgi:hypothetical protein